MEIFPLQKIVKYVNIKTQMKIAIWHQKKESAPALSVAVQTTYSPKFNWFYSLTKLEANHS